jgi:hypothetical protein
MNNKLTPERIEARSADNGTAGGQRMRNSPDYITGYADFLPQLRKEAGG